MTYRDDLPPGDPYLPPGVTDRMIDEANRGDPFRCPLCGHVFEDPGQGERECRRCGWSEWAEQVAKGHGLEDQDAAGDGPVCGEFMPEGGECPF